MQLLCPLNIFKQLSCEILQSLQSLSWEQLTNKSLLLIITVMSKTQLVCPFSVLMTLKDFLSNEYVNIFIARDS